MEEPIVQYTNRKDKSNKVKLGVAVGVVVITLIGIGALLTRQPQKTEEKKEVPITQSIPTPTDKPKIDKEAITIQVLNGTGTPGQAGIAVKALEAAGFSADNIKSANAEKYDNKITTISYRTNYEDAANEIKDVLESSFDEITIASSPLEDESKFDVVVVTGGKIFESETPTPTASSSGSVTQTPSPTP